MIRSTRDPDEVFQFTLRLISQAKRRSGATGSLSLEGIYRCLNRTILYMLSRPHSATQQELSGTLEVLHKLTTNRSIVFGAGNHELDFFGCLTYCLLQITSGQSIPTNKEDSESKTQWHVRPGEDTATEEDEDKDAAASLQRQRPKNHRCPGRPSRAWRWCGGRHGLPGSAGGRSRREWRATLPRRAHGSGEGERVTSPRRASRCSPRRMRRKRPVNPPQGTIHI